MCTDELGAKGKIGRIFRRQGGYKYFFVAKGEKGKERKLIVRAVSGSSAFQPAAGIPPPPPPPLPTSPTPWMIRKWMMEEFANRLDDKFLEALVKRRNVIVPK